MDLINAMFATTTICIRIVRIIIYVNLAQMVLFQIIMDKAVKTVKMDAKFVQKKSVMDVPI